MTKMLTSAAVATAPIRATDHGSAAIPTDLHPLAVGSRGHVLRARRRDPLDTLTLHPSTRAAAEKYRTARNHEAAGVPLEPMVGDTAPDRTRGVYGRLWAQDRALECAALVRRGDAAMGHIAANRRDGVVELFLMAEWTLVAIDRARGQRDGRASAWIKAALERLEAEYGT